ncbi:MAG: dienelactone hydrolase family protein [Tumebacillaceae bacterium]
MALHTEFVTFTSGDKQHKLYVSRLENAKTPLPVVLVIQEIWGTDAHIRDLTDRFAKAGYLAVAPDLYATDNGERPAILSEERIEQVKAFLNSVPPAMWHDAEQREAELNKLPEQQREEIRDSFVELFSALQKIPGFTDALAATFNFLQDYEYSRGQKIASTGYCMGGALSARLASVEPRLAGAAVYYGSLPGKEAVETIQCPVYGFFGSIDERINGLIPAFAESMQAAGKSFKYEMYEGALHAFFNETRPSYNVDAARDAWVKTLAFFKEVLV